MRGFVLASVAVGFGFLALSASQSATAASQNTREYVVFFENNKASLTPEGREIVKAAAERARRSHANLITVAAPMTPVAPGYNPSVADPRLIAVRQELIANGARAVSLARVPASDTVDVPLVGADRVEIRVMTTSQQTT